jgi:hypothetical protein
MKLLSRLLGPLSDLIADRPDFKSIGHRPQRGCMTHMPDVSQAN